MEALLTGPAIPLADGDSIAEALQLMPKLPALSSQTMMPCDGL